MASHTPKRTQEALKKFKELCYLDFYDSSYRNDICDSLEYEVDASEDQFIKVFIPNSEIDDLSNEKFNKYTILTEDRNDILFESETVEEVIKYINENDFFVEELCRRGKPLQDCKCC